MSDALRHPVRTWSLIIAVSFIALIVAAAVWHFTTGWLEPPEEHRWANRDVPQTDGPNLKEVKAYSLANSHGDGTTGATVWDSPNVAVYSAPDAKPPPPPATLQSLSDAGQAHAIDYLAKDGGDVDTGWSRLSKTLSGPGGGIEKKDPYRADRVLVATVSRGMHAMPGDRLLWSRVFVQPINFEFAGYTIAQTDTRTIKIAGIDDTDEGKLSLGFGLDAALSGAGKESPAPALESSRKTTADINQEYENLGIDIRPDFLRIIRESPVGGDVVGNTAIHLSMLTDPQAIRRLDLGGAAATVDDSDIPSLVVDEAHLTDGVKYLHDQDGQIIVHPQDVLPHCPLIANVWMIYEMRKVENGASHYLEGLQTVSLVQDGALRQQVEIVRADDMAPSVWSIKRKKNGMDVSAAPDLRAKTPDGTSRRVVSTDYVTLSELTHWIKAQGARPILHELQFDNVEDDTLVPYKNVRNDCVRSKP